MSEIQDEAVPLSPAEAVDVANVAAARHQFLLTAPVGAVRPADGLEARVARLEALLRSTIGADVLTPEDAQAASVVQDQAAADAEQAEADAQAQADVDAQAAPVEEPPVAPTEPLDTTSPDAPVDTSPDATEPELPADPVMEPDQTAPVVDTPADTATPADAVATAQTLPARDALDHIDLALARWPDDVDLLAAKADLQNELGE